MLVQSETKRQNEERSEASEQRVQQGADFSTDRRKTHSILFVRLSKSSDASTAAHRRSEECEKGEANEQGRRRSESRIAKISAEPANGRVRNSGIHLGHNIHSVAGVGGGHDRQRQAWVAGGGHHRSAELNKLGRRMIDANDGREQKKRKQDG